MKVRKSFFTLLELLTVLLILGIGATVVGIQIKEIYQEQRFLSEVNAITDHLRTAQDLMLLMDADFHFKMRYNEDQQLEYWLKSEKPIKGLFAVDENKLNKKILYGIRSFDFESTLSEKSEELDIRFSFGKNSSGTLILSPHKKDKYDREDHLNDYEIVIYNYPHPIESKPYAEKKVDVLLEDKTESQRLYPVEEELVEEQQEPQK